MSPTSTIPEGSSRAATATATSTTVPAPDQNAAIFESLERLQNGQVEQSDLLHKLHNAVLNSRSIINELVIANHELRAELRGMIGTGAGVRVRGGGNRRSSPPQSRPRPMQQPPPPPRDDDDAATSGLDEIFREELMGEDENDGAYDAMSSSASARVGPTAAAGHDIITDVEIDAILADRRGNGTFPVLQSSLKKFSDHVDLIKVRLHKSDKYRHVPIRIPKTEKNREGTKPCKLCSEGKIKRRTQWMCSICEVPLCTRPLLDEGGNAISHHDRWHTCTDLIVEHRMCHAMLRNGRVSRKRARGGGVDDDED